MTHNCIAVASQNHWLIRAIWSCSFVTCPVCKGLQNGFAVHISCDHSTLAPSGFARWVSWRVLLLKNRELCKISHWLPNLDADSGLCSHSQSLHYSIAEHTGRCTHITSPSKQAHSEPHLLNLMPSMSNQWVTITLASAAMPPFKESRQRQSLDFLFILSLSRRRPGLASPPPEINPLIPS